MKVLSLLPSATEIVYALDAGDALCGVSGDCDYPSDVSNKPTVSRTRLPINEETSPAAIDEMVRAELAVSDSIYTLDRPLIRELRPDVILAQDLCRVCAVPSGHVAEALEVIGCSAEVLSLDPRTLGDVLDDILLVGNALGLLARAESLVTALEGRIERVRRATTTAPRRRVVALEWQDPPFNGGHWIPEMIEIAGGIDLFGRPAERSRTLEWTEVAAAAPDVIVYMPCGYDLTEAVKQLPGLYASATLRATPAAEKNNVFVTDSSAYFSRPGPRLVEGIEVLAGILHPDLVPPPDATKALRVSVQEGRLVTADLR